MLYVLFKKHYISACCILYFPVQHADSDFKSCTILKFSVCLWPKHKLCHVTHSSLQCQDNLLYTKIAHINPRPQFGPFDFATINSTKNVSLTGSKFQGANRTHLTLKTAINSQEIALGHGSVCLYSAKPVVWKLVNNLC